MVMWVRSTGDEYVCASHAHLFLMVKDIFNLSLIVIVWYFKVSYQNGDFVLEFNHLNLI